MVSDIDASLYTPKFSNAFFPIVVTVDGMVRPVTLKQPWNAAPGISVTPSGILMFSFHAEQPQKAFSPIVVREDGKFILSIASQ